MSNELGSMVAGGFSPSMPSLDDMMAQIMRKDAPPAQKSASAQKADDLKKCYAQVYASAAGRRVFEHLMDLTLRASLAPVGGFESIEKVAMAAAAHQSKCDLVATMMAMVVQGQNLKPENAKSKKKV